MLKFLLIILLGGINIFIPSNVLGASTVLSTWSPPQTCNIFEIFFLPITTLQHSQPHKLTENLIYILFNMNPVEGFNLRRDVYVRFAVFIHKLRKLPEFHHVKLVLPPFNHLYHWKSKDLFQQGVRWFNFFDETSFNRYAPVLDFDDFIEEIDVSPEEPIVEVDAVYKLQNFEDMFTNGVFIDKFEINECERYTNHPGEFIPLADVRAKRFYCTKFQGSASLLLNVIKNDLNRATGKPKIFMFLSAEIVLHDEWGNAEFWRARRSMRFNYYLESVAAEFRKRVFNSTDATELVQRPRSWMDEKPYRGAKGGEYICAHLRRGDFIVGREGTTPTLRSAANQIRNKMRELGLQKAFISSDSSMFEFKNLKSYLGRVRVYRFSPESIEEKSALMDGGIAIVDQIICSHARYFIGTYESTFTYRIYEEREILGFPKETTFNTLCKNEDLSNCERNSIWSIVY